MSDAERYRKLSERLLAQADASDDAEERAQLTFEALGWQVKASDLESAPNPNAGG